jgi:hypothetical protein
MTVEPDFSANPFATTEGFLFMGIKLLHVESVRNKIVAFFYQFVVATGPARIGR